MMQHYDLTPLGTTGGLVVQCLGCTMCFVKHHAFVWRLTFPAPAQRLQAVETSCLQVSVVAIAIESAYLSIMTRPRRCCHVSN
jgi:hypothetical protein